LQFGDEFRVLFSGLFPDDAKQCSAFLRHKMYLISPRTLRESSIPFFQVCDSVLHFIWLEQEAPLPRRAQHVPCA